MNVRPIAAALTLAFAASAALFGSRAVHAGDSAAEPDKAPAFTLKDMDGKERKLSEFADKWVVLEWTNLQCPFVRKQYNPKHMQALQEGYVKKGVVWLMVCSSAEGKQGYLSAADWKKAYDKEGCKATTVLIDADGKVGKAYDAKTTPDMRIISPKGVIVYQGAIDDNPAKDADPAKSRCYVSEVLDAVMAGKDAPIAKTRSYGCSIKYAD